MENLQFTPGSIRDVPSNLRAQYRDNEFLRYYRDESGAVHVIHNPFYDCAYVVDERDPERVAYYSTRLEDGEWKPGTVRYNLPRETAMYFASGVLSLQ